MNKKRIEHLTQINNEFITLDEVKLLLRIDSTDEDALLSGYITSAIKLCEEYCNRSFVLQNKKYLLDYIENRVIDLPYSPINSILSLNYYNPENVLSIYDSSNYSLIVDSLVFNDDASLPADLRDNFGIEIIYQTGYTEVPQGIKDAVLQQIKAMYECSCEAGKVTDKAIYMLSPYIINRL